MCDYSLHDIKNRLALDGEELVVDKFHTGSKGLVSAADLEAVQPRNLIEMVRDVLRPERLWDRKKQIPAVCIPHGARLVLSGIPKRMQRIFGINETEEVTLIQLTAESFLYRDAVQFDHRILLPCNPHGGYDVLSLQNLECGIRAKVLSLELEDEQPAATGISYQQSFGRITRANA